MSNTVPRGNLTLRFSSTRHRCWSLVPNVSCYCTIGSEGRVASVSVEQRAKNGVLGILPTRKMGREQKSAFRPRGQNAENPVLRSLLHGNACYAGYWLGCCRFVVPEMILLKTFKKVLFFSFWTGDTVLGRGCEFSFDRT